METALQMVISCYSSERRLHGAEGDLHSFESLNELCRRFPGKQVSGLKCQEGTGFKMPACNSEQFLILTMLLKQREL